MSKADDLKDWLRKVTQVEVIKSFTPCIPRWYTFYCIGRLKIFDTLITKHGCPNYFKTCNPKARSK